MTVAGVALPRHDGPERYLISMRSGVPPNAMTQKPAAETEQRALRLVGQRPLKEIVKLTTSGVERVCIETALELTRGNRVAAARLLGLSRQSLYSKLALHEIDGARTNDASNADK